MIRNPSVATTVQTQMPSHTELDRTPRSPRIKLFSPRLLPLLMGLALLALWYFQTRTPGQASFVLSSPQAVWDEFISMVNKGTFWTNLGTTLVQIALGLFLGVSVAFALGYAIARSRLLERMIGPYAVGFQAVPIIAIAPTLIILFGPGIATNSVICALIVFFPMLINTMVGMRSADPDLKQLMRSLHASRWQMFRYLELPAALPSLFGGLKISTTLAVIGAVVGEAINASAGLGFLIYSSRYAYKTAGVYVGIFTLTALALVLYEIVARIERAVLAWQRAGRS